MLFLEFFEFTWNYDSAFLPNTWIPWFPDCCGLEAFGEEAGIVEIHSVNRPFIRCRNGNAHLHSHSLLLMVPICIDIPNPAHVQPSIQQRPGNLSYPCWKQSQHWNMMILQRRSFFFLLFLFSFFICIFFSFLFFVVPNARACISLHFWGCLKGYERSTRFPPHSSLSIITYLHVKAT